MSLPSLKVILRTMVDVKDVSELVFGRERTDIELVWAYVGDDRNDGTLLARERRQLMIWTSIYKHAVLSV